MNAGPVRSKVPAAAAWLGWGGVLPFLGGTAGLWMWPEHAGWWQASILAYGAVVLSFMGGIHWGIAFGLERGAAGVMVASVVPALLGWAALLMPPVLGLLTLIAGFLGIHLYDRMAITAGRAPAWYRVLRSPLTVAVTVILVAALAGLLRLG
jgi:hypothetical protein